MTWPGPKLGIPESVRDLDHDRVVAVLVATNVNISAAARRLHVPSSDLRRLMNANPDLLALAAEKEERRLDKAEAILDRELNSDDPRYSAAAAFFVLRNAKRAVVRVGVNPTSRLQSRTRHRRKPISSSGRGREGISARLSSNATGRAFLFRAMTGAMTALRAK
jgi:hypothetical protein